MAPMNRTLRLLPPRLLLSALLAIAATACNDVREAVGITKKMPDEFEVVKQAPLVLPPNFTLRPPEPGAPRPQELQPREAAQAALTGRRQAPAGDATPLLRTGGANSAPRSAGESALLSQANATNVDPSIRRTISEETTNLLERDKSFVDRLVFWQKPPPPGLVVDATKESQRLREVAASGTPANKGDVPVIQRKQRGILEDIF